MCKSQISFDYLEDNFFTEFKWNEIWTQRTATYTQMGDLVDKYVSRNWMRKNILRISEEEWIEMQKEIEEDAKADAENTTGESEESPNSNKESSDKKKIEIESDSEIKINPDKKELEDE